MNGKGDQTVEKTALALGTFDGVHIGHKKVLAAALQDDYKAMAVTFSVPPRAQLTGEENSQLTTREEKEALLYGMGVIPVFLDFKQICHLAPTDFLNFLIQRFKPDRLSCGFNYHFGKNAAGDTKLLRQFCREKGIDCKVAKAVKASGLPVSSTAIRALIAQGELPQANLLLGRAFSYTGTVQHGAARGRRLGFPTANINYPNGLVRPKFGVYAGYTTVNGQTFRSVTNLGVRPTFHSEKIISETFLFDFSGDIYGKNITVSLLAFIRPEQKFSGEQELKKMVELDKQAALLRLASVEPVTPDK